MQDWQVLKHTGLPATTFPQSSIETVTNDFRAPIEYEDYRAGLEHVPLGDQKAGLNYSWICSPGPMIKL